MVTGLWVLEEGPGGLTASHKKSFNQFPIFSPTLNPYIYIFWIPELFWGFAPKKEKKLLLFGIHSTFFSVSYNLSVCMQNFMAFSIWTIFSPIFSLLLSEYSPLLSFQGTLGRYRVKRMYSVDHANRKSFIEIQSTNKNSFSLKPKINRKAFPQKSYYNFFTWKLPNLDLLHIKKN